MLYIGCPATRCYRRLHWVGIVQLIGYEIVGDGGFKLDRMPLSMQGNLRLDMFPKAFHIDLVREICQPPRRGYISVQAIH